MTIDPPLAVTDDEQYIRPIMAAMGYPDDVFAPPTNGNRVVALFMLPTIDEIAPARYACFIGEHYHTDPDDNGYILATISSTYFTPEQAAEFFRTFLDQTNPIHADKMPAPPPAHIVSRN